MEFSFEFDCPPFASFRSNLGCAETEQTDLDPANPMDRWFTVEHTSQASQTKYSNPQNQEDVSPIVRRSLNKEQIPQQQLQISNAQEEPEATREEQQKEPNIPPKENPFKKKEVKKTVHFKRNVIANQRILNPKQKLSKPKTESKLNKDEQKGMVTRSKSGNQSRAHSKDNWPCPMPTKVQRDWQSKHHSKWYDLSASSKKKALQSMKEQVVGQKEQGSKKEGQKTSRSLLKRGKS